MILAKNRQFGYKLFAVRVRPVAFRMSRQSQPDIQVDACDRCSASKKNVVPARTLLIFAVVLALTVLRVRPPEFVSFASHACASTHEVKDKKQCLERTGTEFAVQTATFHAALPIADFILPPTYIGAEAQRSKGAYRNRPPPLS